jgi:hypothetical protein
MGLATADISPPTAPERIPSLVSTRNAAALLQCSPRHVRKLKDEGRLTPCQYEGFGKLLFDLDQVLENGRPITWLSRHLGHSSLAVTSETYGHWEAAERKREAAAMEGAFGDLRAPV